MFCLKKYSFYLDASYSFIFQILCAVLGLRLDFLSNINTFSITKLSTVLHRFVHEGVSFLCECVYFLQNTFQPFVEKVSLSVVNYEIDLRNKTRTRRNYLYSAFLIRTHVCHVGTL